MSEVPGDSHWQVVDNLHEAFSRYRQVRPDLILRIGHGSEVRYIIPELETDRHPDVAIAFRDAPYRRASATPGQALAVEVVSPGSQSRRRDLRGEA